MKVKVKRIEKSEFGDYPLLIFDDEKGQENYIAFSPKVQQYVKYKPVNVGDLILVIVSLRNKKKVYLLKKILNSNEVD